ncbi:MAG TPA: ATP-binding protein [Novosphingobium sp.]|nr:ATP-binding protein [Novosphingobium sp.]
MDGERRVPWLGMMVALGISGWLMLSGVNTMSIALLGPVWLLSLWLDWLRPVARPAIRIAINRPDIDALTREAMTRTLEGVSLPLVLMERHRIMAANGAARAAFGAHIVGQDARIALRHPEAMRLLDMPSGGSVTIRGLTGTGSLWQLTRQTIDSRFWTIELRDRTTEADLGRAHTDFVANASHELRTPLSSIIGYVETIADDPGRMEPDTTRRFLGTVLREARRMQNLVSDLMSLSQLEAEKHDLPSERVDLGRLAHRVVGEFAPGPQGSGPRLRLSRPDETISVAGDVKQLEQLLRNLIDNALKYADGSQPVEVSLAGAPRGMVELVVADHGQGIAPEHLPHLTRRFYRTDPGRSRAAGGTGLGLAIVKHIVERHRGRLDITSQLGVGTQVHVRLPLAAAPS